MVSILDGQGYIGIRIVGEAVVIGIFEGREDGVSIGTDSFNAFFAIVFMVGTGNGSTVSMVGDDDDQGIVTVFLIPFLSIFDSLIEFNRIVGSTLPIHGVELFVDGCAFDHSEEALRILAKDIQGFFRHVNEVRLIRIFP